MIYLEVAGWRHWGSSPLQSLSSLLRDVTALARSWTSSDGQIDGPADRHALEGAVAKSRTIYKRGSRESRDSRERARTLARRFKPSGLDLAHRRLVQSVSVWGGAPSVSRLSALVTLCDEKLNFYPCIKTLIRFTHL